MKKIYSQSLLYNEDVGMNLREIRIRLGLTQKELSLIIDIAQTAIARYENNKVKPTSTVIIKYINELNANPLYLFTRIEPVFLDEQKRINTEFLISKKKRELQELINTL